MNVKPPPHRVAPIRSDPDGTTGRTRRSDAWFDRPDLDGFLHRSWLKASGFSDSAFRGRPVIGICNSWSELVNCNVHLRGLAEAVKRGVLQAGGCDLDFLRGRSKVVADAVTYL